MASNEPYTYDGDELALFATAVNYKKYVATYLKPFITGDVLDVGSGIGANIPFLMNESVRSWTSLEPDATLLSQVPPAVHGVSIKKVHGVVSRVDFARKFNTILYIDVLEHIAEDAGELCSAAACLDLNHKDQGRIIVLSPAHQHLFSEFDKQVGHVKRYSASSITSLAPKGFLVRHVFYLDSIGYFLSLANRFLLKEGNPTPGQIAFWDTAVIPLSRLFDRILCNKFGKTVVAVFEACGRNTA